MAVSHEAAPASGPASEPSFDTTATYVRVTGERPDGFVEFDFAIGEPEIFVELILPPEAFAEFCEANTVTVLEPAADSPPDPADTDGDPFAWRLADARLPTPN
jgi:phenol hydroxylase P0 protein